MLIALAAAAVVCRPPSAHTLAQDAQARVYVSSGTAYGCHRGHRPLRLGSVAKARLAGRFAAVVRDDRVSVFDLRARRAMRRGGADGPVHALRVLGDGTAGWIAGDGAARTVFVDGTPYGRGDTIDPAFLGLAAG